MIISPCFFSLCRPSDCLEFWLAAVWSMAEREERDFNLHRRVMDNEETPVVEGESAAASTSREERQRTVLGMEEVS